MLSDPAFRRIQQLARFAKLTGPISTANTVASGQIAFSDIETYNNMLLIQHFGFASVPTPGCNLMTTNRSGDVLQGVVTASHDPRSYPVGMAAGETQIHDNAGQRVYLRGGTTIVIAANGNVTITANTAVAITSPMLTLTGSMVVMGDVTAGGISLRNHWHGGVQPGDGITGIPTGTGGTAPDDGGA